MEKSLYILLVVLLTLIAGCTHTRYVWNDYDATLYNHYKEPAQVEQFSEALKNIVIESEEDKKVPPGIYAEYGYILYEQGYNAEAIQYFEKESRLWPESRVLMAKMTLNAKARFEKQGDKDKPGQKVKLDKNAK